MCMSSLTSMGKEPAKRRNLSQLSSSGTSVQMKEYKYFEEVSLNNVQSSKYHPVYLKIIKPGLLSTRANKFLTFL